MAVEELSLISQLHLEALQRYLEAYPETANQVAMDAFADYLRQLYVTERLITKNATLEATIRSKQRPPQLFPIPIEPI